jgi:hypothetical protein
MHRSIALKEAPLEVSPPPVPDGAFEVYSKDPGYLVAAADRYVFMVVKVTINNTTLSLLRRAFVAQSERHAEFGFIIVLEPGCQLILPSDIRIGLTTMVKRHAWRCSGAAIVYEKTGFHATALRSVVTAINFASRATHPTRVSAELAEGVAWLHELTGGRVTAGRLIQIATQLRQLL